MKNNPLKSSFRRIPYQESAFAQRVKKPAPESRFYAAVKMAIAHPAEVIEIEWPEDLNRGQISTELLRASQPLGFRLHVSGRESLRVKGVFQIQCGKRIDDEPGEPEKEYSVELPEHRNAQ